MELSRRQIIAYVVVAAVVVAVGVRYVVAPRVSGPSGEPIVLSSAAPGQGSSASQAASSGGAAASGSASPAADALVYVCGAVHSPGVVRLPQGARVADALELAGGATAKAELAAVNLAARVADGQQIVVPEKGPSGVAQAASSGGGTVGATVGGSAGAGSGLPGALVNLNTASIEELDGLQGVGPSTAQKIIDYRTENGPFTSIEDVKNVSGIGDAKFAAMKDSITV